MKYAILLLLVAVLSVASVLFYLHYWSPHGHREAFMRGMDSSLQNYATDHGGWFPDMGNPWDALAKLYPSYCNSELAGLTGNTQAVTDALKAGQSISNFTSWIYVPGLREGDDGRLAILWEAKQGISANGRLNFRGTRPVLLLNRDITNVATVNWEDFQKQQEELRSAIRARRGIQTNAPPQ
jgi:hypothetical protein